MDYECEIKEQISQSALTIRTRTPVEKLPQVLGEGYGTIAQYFGELKKQPLGPPFAIYYNMDMQDLDIEFGFPVEPGIEGKDNIQKSNSPGGKVATCLYTGPYKDIEPAYNCLMKWIKDHGHETTDIAYEVYLNDPSVTPSQELKTQIAFILKTA